MLNLPTEIQAKIFQELTLEDKCPLMNMEEFSNILTSKCAWRKLPKISLQKFKIMADLFTIDTGLYWHKEINSFLDIRVNKSCGTITIKVFSKYHALEHQRFNLNYNFNIFKQFILNLKQKCTSVNCDIYIRPDGKYILFKKHYIKNAPKDTLLQMTEDNPTSYILKHGRCIYFIDVSNHNASEWISFLNSYHKYLKLKAKLIEFEAFKIWLIKNWKTQYKLSITVKYNVLSRKKCVKATYVI